MRVVIIAVAFFSEEKLNMLSLSLVEAILCTHVHMHVHIYVGTCSRIFMRVKSYAA